MSNVMKEWLEGYRKLGFTIKRIRFGALITSPWRKFDRVTQGRQVVRHQPHKLANVGSIPTPATSRPVSSTVERLPD